MHNLFAARRRSLSRLLGMSLGAGLAAVGRVPAALGLRSPLGAASALGLTAARPGHARDAADPSWQAVVQRARGQQVFFNAWGGS